MTLTQREKEITRAVSMIAEEYNVRVCIDQSIRGALICGTGAFLGALAGGPEGIAFGGAVAGLYAMCSSDSYRSLPEVLKTMDTKHIKNMLHEIKSAVYKMDRTDFLTLISTVLLSSGGEHVRKIKLKIINTIVSFFERVLRKQVTFLQC